MTEKPRTYGFEPDMLYRPSDPAMKQIAKEGQLAKWRHYGKGPSFLKIGSSVLYLGQDVIEWLEKHRVEIGEVPA